MYIILALFCCLLSVAAVYVSWRQQRQFGWAVGLLLLGAASYLFSHRSGWEQGIFFALFVPGILIWIAIFAERSYKPFAAQAVAPREIIITWRKAAGHLATGGAILVIQLMCSLVIAVGISRLLPMEEAGQLAVCVVLQPLLWAALMFHFMGRYKKPSTLGWHCVLALLFSLTLAI